MKQALRLGSGLTMVWSAVVVALLISTAGAIAAADRWLHVRVEKTGAEAESVRVNLPLRLAEKVLPAVHARQLQGGKLKLKEIHVEQINLRSVLEAVRGLEDGEFVTIESPKESVRVAKQGGSLLAKIHERNGDGDEEKVDVRIPFAVVEALLSGAEDELDILAAVRALSAHPDELLVTVIDRRETVRIWVDSRPTTE